MQNADWSDDELLSWLDEMLSAERMAEVEADLRSDELLRTRIATLIHVRDQGAHTVGAIWRRNRISCPSRRQLSGYLLGTLEQETTDYIDFHIHTVGCRYCAANLNDLEAASAAAGGVERRRQRFFQSSAGYLKGDASS